MGSCLRGRAKVAKRWLTKHFSSPDTARETIATISLTMGVTGFALVMVGVYLSS